MDTMGGYLLQALHREGVRHVFGVPGDYILRWYQLLSQSNLKHVGTSREDCAAFAADGYARCHGLGALAVTYGVGALNVVNAVAGANAESSPVVVISGAPGVAEQRQNPLLHHRFGPFCFQREIFERMTCYAAALDDPLLARRQIDRALELAQLHHKPVYLELPRDLVDAELPPALSPPTSSAPISDWDALEEAVAETLSLLAKAKSAAVLAGSELHRYQLQDELTQLVERGALPVAATLTGKSVIAERHPAYMGIYEGAMGGARTRELIERADVLLLLGATLNDVDLGIFTAKLDVQHMVQATADGVQIHHHRYTGVPLGDYVRALTAGIERSGRSLPVVEPPLAAIGFPITSQPMTVARLIGRLNDTLPQDMIVVCDTGDCLFASLELRVHARTAFLASAFYTTMGFAVPASLGAQLGSGRRPLVLVGDGAFQMTGTELATAAWKGLNPIVIVFNNAGYSTERFILDGPFNDIPSWQFHRLGELFGPLAGFDVHDEESFDSAWRSALAQTDRPSLLNVHLAPDDPSPAMRRLGEHLGKRVRAG
ncbi:alpha-keto acid decarboxylase family protein [Andreprevotia chitinilytica]|uniref:alpha-keto acid decarboxylase family protein n=1 Tax=Andreprevotia chitinilytica TaxID=396808 RepID=UPI000A9D9400|nr:thiamine pyrophosphate-binding protein [Andreprevotia chitinilytica]